MVLDRNRTRALIFLFAALTFGVFLVQILASPLSPLLATFFEALKFVLAVGIGFLLQIILSSDEFRQEFQRFAISAYRRISDIRYSVFEIRNDILTQRSRYAQTKIHELDPIAARAEEIERQVMSSQDDWRDFLKREITALEEIDVRQERIRDIVASRSTADAQDTEEIIGDLKEEIRHLADSLPYSLKTLIDVERGEALPREGRHSTAVAEYIMGEIRENGFIQFPVDTRSELDQAQIDRISANSPFGFYIDVAMGSEYFAITGKDGSEIGLAANPLPSVYDKDFYFTLQEFLPLEPESRRVMWDPGNPLEIPGSEFSRVASQWENHFYIKVPAASVG